MSSKKHQRRSGTVQEEGLTNEGRSYLLLLHNQTHDKRNTVGSLHAYINRAMCEVSKFLRKNSKLLFFFMLKIPRLPSSGYPIGPCLVLIQGSLYCKQVTCCMKHQLTWNLKLDLLQ